jgi:hypothetical protein
MSGSAGKELVNELLGLAPCACLRTVSRPSMAEWFGAGGETLWYMALYSTEETEHCQDLRTNRQVDYQ